MPGTSGLPVLRQSSGSVSVLAIVRSSNIGEAPLLRQLRCAGMCLSLCPKRVSFERAVSCLLDRRCDDFTPAELAHSETQHKASPSLPESYTTQSRFGSFTYKRFTVPQEVHRSAKRVSRFSLSDHLKKPFSFSLQRRPGRTSPPPPEAETVRPLMSWEPPQCSHVLSGMGNYSP